LIYCIVASTCHIGQSVAVAQLAKCGSWYAGVATLNGRVAN